MAGHPCKQHACPAGTSRVTVEWGKRASRPGESGPTATKTRQPPPPPPLLPPSVGPPLRSLETLPLPPLFYCHCSPWPDAQLGIGDPDGGGRRLGDRHFVCGMEKARERERE